MPSLARFGVWVTAHRFLSLLGLAAGVLLVNAIELCRDKAFAIDEFLYAHKAWLITRADDGLFAAIGRGEAFVPSMIMSPFAALGGDDPGTLIYVRLSMLVAVIAVAAGVALLAGGDSIERRDRAGVGLVAILVLLGSPTVMKHLVEIRPDGVAIALLIGALAVLRWRRLGDRTAAALAGLLVFAACASSLKAVVIGAGLAPVFALDLATGSRRPQTLRSALGFAAGFTLGAAAVLAIVFSTSSLAHYWHGVYGIMGFHEEHYTAIKLDRFLWPYVLRWWPVLLLAALGATIIAGERWRAWHQRREIGIDALVVLFWLGGWASFVLQKAAYPYSLIPIGVTSAILAARAVHWIAAPLREVRGGRVATIGGGVLLAGFTAMALGQVTPKHHNDEQLEVLRTIGELTTAGDAAYDMSGAYVYRPHGHRFVFVDKSRRRGLGAELDREVPRSLIDREVVMFVWDARFASHWRKRRLGKFVLEHYQPYSEELFFWGSEIRAAADTPTTHEFLAVKTGRYFVHPPAAATRIRIDGQPLERPTTELTRGPHRVEITAAAKDADIYLVWLPATGVPFNPTRHRSYNARRKNRLARWILP